jgi:uncharacterized membrane protein YvbJ
LLAVARRGLFLKEKEMNESKDIFLICIGALALVLVGAILVMLSSWKSERKTWKLREEINNDMESLFIQLLNISEWKPIRLDNGSHEILLKFNGGNSYYTPYQRVNKRWEPEIRNPTQK